MEFNIIQPTPPQGESQWAKDMRLSGEGIRAYEHRRTHFGPVNWSSVYELCIALLAIFVIAPLALLGLVTMIQRFVW